jgi:putative phage-type endonuclease
MIIIDLPQGSPEWFAERAGNVSASNFGKILTPTGAKTSGKVREDYKYQLAGERISKTPEESFKTPWMDRGNELEPEARDRFEIDTGMFVAQVGLVYLDDRKIISCSPDGLVMDDSGLELKCPKLSTHIRYIEEDVLPLVYKPQVQGCMWVCNRPTWVFMSYHPSVRHLVKVISRDEQYISLQREAVEEFNAEVETIVGRLLNA